MTSFYKTDTLTPMVKDVMLNSGTEAPFTGAYHELTSPGSYLCRQCGLALYRASQKFPSSCGWPSFDKTIKDHVHEKPDPDGMRTEILCKRCEGHLGHVFKGESLTPLNIRYCVNSLALDYVNDENIIDTGEGIFAGGCFWGIEHLFKQLTGVVKAESGYIGGHIENPSYDEVCTGQSGHYEAVRVLYDTELTDFKKVARYFFEIHNPAQSDGQGPDHGPQYQSAVFTYDAIQSRDIEDLLLQLKANGINPSTQVLTVSTFWPAEAYHQAYYEKNGQVPYCHRYEKRFSKR